MTKKQKTIYTALALAATLSGFLFYIGFSYAFALAFGLLLYTVIVYFKIDIE